jgi:acetylornithine deacetylase/succinyl-diaminopimelate desuccinylase-like protein
MSNPDAPTPADTLDDAVRALCDFIAVPSISAQGSMLREGADATARILTECGLTVTELDGPGAPVILGSLEVTGSKATALFYGHYDVQPPDPVELWDSDPFVARERAGAIYGRGAGDNKGQLLAHLFAIRDLHRAGELATSVKVLVEGEEEIGSPNIGDVVERHRDRLQADLAITADAALPDDGRPAVIFGVRGLLYAELEARGARSDLHSGNRGGLAPYPAWDLVQALASLRNAEGRVTIPGFYDAVREPDASERRMLAALPVDATGLAHELGVAELSAAAARRPWQTLMFEPAFNIAGITAGYSGAGAKTVIPSRASCKIDVRLVADQDPDEVFAALRDRVREVAPMVAVRRLAAVPPSTTSPDSPWALKVTEGVRAATGTEPTLRPRMGGTTPDWVFTRILGIPSILVPYGPTDMSHHAPNERMTLTALERGIRCTREILRTLAV